MALVVTNALGCWSDDLGHWTGQKLPLVPSIHTSRRGKTLPPKIVKVFNSYLKGLLEKNNLENPPSFSGSPNSAHTFENSPSWNFLLFLLWAWYPSYGTTLAYADVTGLGLMSQFKFTETVQKATFAAELSTSLRASVLRFQLSLNLLYWALYNLC